MTPHASIETIVFSDGTTLKLDPGDIVVIVGPNNAGKSLALRGIRDKFSETNHANDVVRQMSIASAGSVADLLNWLDEVAIQTENGGEKNNPYYKAFGISLLKSSVESAWHPEGGLQALGKLFCNLLSAEKRLEASNPAKAIAIGKEPPTHLIHVLQKDDKLEKTLSDQFRRAFGVDLVVHRNAGKVIPFLVGEAPIPASGEDRLSYNFLLRVNQLPELEKQGDGMRSFAGVLLHTAVGIESVLLIDEPEAFLHPPQARLLGRMFVQNLAATRQLIIATHSGDVLRGILDANSGNVRVIRIRREGRINPTKELEKAKIKELWVDPLLRASNILDGVFHEKVVVCEGDGDARFFGAVMDAMFEGQQNLKRRPDVMFTHCGGKSRLPLVVRSLRALDVPVVAVPDFDILNDENPLGELVSAAGGDWNALKPTWLSVKNAVEAIKPQLNANEVKVKIDLIFQGVNLHFSLKK